LAGSAATVAAQDGCSEAGFPAAGRALFRAGLSEFPFMEAA